VEPEAPPPAREPELVSARPSAVELLAQRVGYLDSGHLSELGLSQRAIEAVWRDCVVVNLPSFSRPLVPVPAFLALMEGNTYCDRCADRVTPGRAQRHTSRAHG
jgi:hypothetical protein